MILWQKSLQMTDDPNLTWRPPPGNLGDVMDYLSKHPGLTQLEVPMETYKQILIDYTYLKMIPSQIGINIAPTGQSLLLMGVKIIPRDYS